MRVCAHTHIYIYTLASWQPNITGRAGRDRGLYHLPPALGRDLALALCHLKSGSTPSLPTPATSGLGSFPPLAALGAGPPPRRSTPHHQHHVPEAGGQGGEFARGDGGQRLAGGWGQRAATAQRRAATHCHL